MMVRAVVPPTVPEGTSRVRICLHAGNTEEEVKTLVAMIHLWAISHCKTTTGAEVAKEREVILAKGRL